MYQEHENIPSDNKATGDTPLPGGNLFQIHTASKHLQQTTELPIHARIRPDLKEGMFFLPDISTTNGQPCNARRVVDCVAWKTQGLTLRQPTSKGLLIN